MNRELEALEKNDTWTIFDFPDGKHVIGCAWKYHWKYHVDGIVDKPKFDLVAQGFTQVEGIDYHDSFSPIAKWTTI